MRQLCQSEKSAPAKYVCDYFMRRRGFRPKSEMAQSRRQCGSLRAHESACSSDPAPAAGLKTCHASKVRLGKSKPQTGFVSDVDFVQKTRFPLVALCDSSCLLNGCTQVLSNAFCRPTFGSWVEGARELLNAEVTRYQLSVISDTSTAG